MSEYQPASSAPPLSPADEQLWSTLAHVGNVIGFLPSPLIMLILGPRSARVRLEAREALNFVITALIAWVSLAILGGIVGILYDATPTDIDLVFVLLRFLVGLAQFAVWVLLVVFSILAAVRVSNGGTYRYPFSLRLVS